VSWLLSTSSIKFKNPYPAGQPFQVVWEVFNGDHDQPPHTDHVNVWDHHSTKVVDQDFGIEPVPAGSEYMCVVDVPALQPGQYDMAITIDTGGSDTLAGTIQVQ
jgi:hypothetical protein